MLNELLILSSNIIYEKYTQNSVFIRYGEKGKKAYILLKGEIDILVPQPQRMLLPENDFLFFLANCAKFNEIGLLNLNVTENFSVLPLAVFDDVSHLMTKQKRRNLKRYIENILNGMIQKLLLMLKIFQQLLKQFKLITLRLIDYI